MSAPSIVPPRWTGFCVLVGLAAALLSACDGVPESCDRLCSAAVPAQEACLADAGADWASTQARGWGSAEAFVVSCETWAWEARQLQRDAWWRGERGEARLEQTCEERAEALLSSPTCETLEAQGWTLPWEDGA